MTVKEWNNAAHAMMGVPLWYRNFMFGLVVLIAIVMFWIGFFIGYLIWGA